MTVGAEWPFPWPQDKIAHYTAFRAAAPLVIDGRLDEESWRLAPRSPRFVDLITGRPTIHDTRAAVLWDDDYLYVGFWVEEPFVEATLTERDSLVWTENDIEVFVAGKDAYYELELSPLGTLYEAFFVWEDGYERSGYSHAPELARTADGAKPWNGVGFNEHPRGPRIGYFKWDLPGVQAAAHVDGTINDNTDRDRGWTGRSPCPGRACAPSPTAAPCRRATAMSGAWISRASTSIARPSRPRTRAAGPGARMACGTRTFLSCSPTSTFRRTW